MSQNEINRLWIEYYSWIKKCLASFYSYYYLNTFSCDLGDLINEYYFFFTRAVSSYDPTKGNLKPRLYFYMKNCVKKVKKNAISIKYNHDPSRKKFNIKYDREIRKGVLSLNSSIPDENLELINIVQGSSNLEKTVFSRDIINKIYNLLQTEKDKKLFEHRIIGKNYTLKETGSCLACSGERIRQRESQLRKKIKKYLEDNGYSKEFCYQDV